VHREGEEGVTEDKAVRGAGEARMVALHSLAHAPQTTATAGSAVESALSISGGSTCVGRVVDVKWVGVDAKSRAVCGLVSQSRAGAPGKVAPWFLLTATQYFACLVRA
jgi:hypothetical protein